MKISVTSGLVLGALMASAGAGAKYLTPTEFLSHLRPPIVLAEMVPSKFGHWQEEKNLVNSVVTPEMKAMLQKIYTQTLSRTYVNDRGEHLMLSVAYGGDQRDGMQVHYPEVCYPAQGFQLEGMRDDTLATSYGNIPVKRLETSMGGQRYEPVTYWTTVGDQAVRGGLAKKLAEMRYSIHGQIADGLLFRVSVLDRNSEAGFALQDGFVRELMAALPGSARQRLAGLDTPGATP